MEGMRWWAREKNPALRCCTRGDAALRLRAASAGGLSEDRWMRL